MGPCQGLGSPLPSYAVQGLLGNPFEEGFPVTGLYCSTVVSLYSNSYVHRLEAVHTVRDVPKVPPYGCVSHHHKTPGQSDFWLLTHFASGRRIEGVTQEDLTQDSHQVESHFDLSKQREQAISELYWAVKHSGVSGPGGLIGLTSRRIIQEALTSDSFYALHKGFRQGSTRETWKSLVQEASRRPLSLGFIRFDEGIPGLAGMLRRDHTTLSRNLKTWSEQRDPLVIVDKMKQPGRKPFAYMIQIPTLTEWLSFTASAKGFAETGMPGVMTWSQIRAFPKKLVPKGVPAPPAGTPVLFEDAKRQLEAADPAALRRRRERRRSR